MRIFSFWDDSNQWADFWRVFPEAVEATLAATAGSGVMTALENEGACFIGTSAHLADAARRLPQPSLKFLWDPGNSTRRGMPPRDEDVDVYFDRVALVHAKDGTYDAASETSAAALIGQGQTDFAAELARLHRRGYSGALTLEPHYCPDDDCVEGMRRSLDALRTIAAEQEISLG